MTADYRTTREKVIDCRDKFSIGLETAKAIVRRDELRLDISRAEDLDDIKRVLLEAFPAREHSLDY